MGYRHVLAKPLPLRLTHVAAYPESYFSGDYADVAGVEYSMLSGERAVVLRPVNPDRTVRRVEVITGFYRLLAETLN